MAILTCFEENSSYFKNANITKTGSVIVFKCICSSMCILCLMHVMAQLLGSILYTYSRLSLCRSQPDQRNISRYTQFDSNEHRKFDNLRDTTLAQLGKAKINPGEYGKGIDILVSDRCICMSQSFIIIMTFIFTYSIVSIKKKILWLFQESNFQSIVSLFRSVIADKIVYSRIQEI